MQKKLFLTYVIIIVFLSSVIGFYSLKICREHYTDDYKKHLLLESTIASSSLEQQYRERGLSGLDEVTAEIAKQLELRVTVIDKDGNILSDSEKNPDNLNKDKIKKEVQAALEGETSVVSRYSDTAKADYIYAAVPIHIDGTPLVLRFSVPLLALKNIKTQMMIYILSSVIISSIIAFFCAYFFSRKISEPLDELTAIANEITNERYDKKNPVDSNDQIGVLTHTFNQMSLKLNSTVHQLEQENKKLEAIVNSMINGVVAVDPNYKILMINSMCYSLFDITIKDIIGYRFHDIFKNKAVCKLLETSAEEKRPIVDEFVLKSPFHGDKILRVYVTPISGAKKGQERIGSLLVFQDITQIRKLEQIRNDFVSNVTHELKTPLTSIMGFTDTLKTSAIDDHETAMRFLDIIDIETKRLYRLIQDILSLSEIETRKEDINMQPESINGILADVEKLLRPQAEEKGLFLQMETEDNLPLFTCNRDRISQMFINLIENAIKYTEKGTVTVLCKNQERYLEIAVSDTGIGIPTDSIDRIFERFYRVDKGRSRKAGGTGLGLSIVKHIMILYDGRVNVISKEGEGTTFVINLPYQEVKET